MTTILIVSNRMLIKLIWELHNFKLFPMHHSQLVRLRDKILLFAYSFESE